MAKETGEYTVSQVDLPDSPKKDYGGRWIIRRDGKPVRSNGIDGDLVTFDTAEIAGDNIEWAKAAVARGESLYDARSKRAAKADADRGIVPPPPPPVIPKAAKVGR